MANTLTNILPKILAKGLMTLRQTALMPRLVNSDWSREAAKKGTTIDIPVPTAATIVSVTPSNVLLSPGDTTPDLVQVSLNQWKQNTPFHLTDKEMTEIDRNAHFVPMQMEEAVKGLANTVNDYIFSFYYRCYGYFANATSPFNDITDATNARKILNDQLCPRDNRRGVLNSTTEALALKLSAFSDLEKTGDKDVKIEGELGKKFGIHWFSDDAVPSHTAGTPGGTPVVNGAHAVGATTIAVDGLTGTTGDYHQGDIITFAGDTQTYAVQALATANAGGEVNLSILPALKIALDGEEAVTLKATHVVNLVFHRDAFAFASRPLMASTQDVAFGSMMMSRTDPVTGLTLRLEVSRQHKQVIWEFDILYGANLVRPELCMRIAG